MEISEGQFTTLPNKVVEDTKLGLDDVTVYLMCKLHMNGETREAFPSYDTLKRECEMARNKVITCIKNLANSGFITIRKKDGKKSNFYYFPPEKEEKFEMIALAFLQNPNLSAREKGYLSILQKYYKVDKDTRTGFVTLTRKEILEVTNVSTSMLTRLESGLTEKEIFQTLTSSTIDSISKVHRNNRLTNLEKTKQAETILAENADAMKKFMGYAFKEIVSAINQLNDRIDKMERQQRLGKTPKMWLIDNQEGTGD